MLQDNCSPLDSLILTFSDDSTRTNNGTCSDFNYEIFRTWVLEDDCGNRTSGVQTITVQDTTAPTFTVPRDTIVACEDSTFFTSTTDLGDVTDEMDNCATGLEATFLDISMEEDTCIGESRIQRIWTLVDVCGNMRTDTQMIQRIDTVAPTFTVPSDTVLDCILLIDSLEITGDVEDEMDNCDILSGMNATFIDETISQACPNEIVLRRIWSLMDDCGNMTLDTQIISVIDTFAPTFVLPPDIEIECTSDSMPVTTGEVIEFSDSCGIPPTITFSDLVINGACQLVDTIIRTWTATDACDNTTSGVQRIIRRCPITVEAGVDVTLCSNGQVNLTSLGAAINTPSTITGTWTTSGSGVFQPDDSFENATTYIPSAGDINARSIQLFLSANVDVSCGSFSDSLDVNFLLVNCGQFPWNGN